MGVGTQRLDFAEFYRRSVDDCLRTVLVSVGDKDTAQDLVDEAFAHAFASWRAAGHAARPGAIRELTLEDIDLPSRRISIAGHRQPLGEFTRDALLAWLDYRRATWPHTANRHVLITRKSALGTGPVSATYLADYLGRHQRGISLEYIRRDGILAEALATGADPLHLALVLTSTTPTRWPTPTPPATFSAAQPNRLCHVARNRH